MLHVTERIQIPDAEFQWSFARSGGPGGQNVNKVASKAVLHWHVNSPSVPPDVLARLRAQQHTRINAAGALVLSSERYRDQGRNIEDCLEKLRELIVQATIVPKKRRPTKPGRGARERRLKSKHHQSARKEGRRRPSGD
ncbi:peptide chain release factor I [Planctomycetaceae bacterium SCGC AG-212-D15]|nr:peptide chain release factor I [Planctomycetaceae bacterium SCGC AG-212-D15]